MSRIAELQGKGKKIKIGDLEFELKPLTVKDLELISVDENAPIEKQMEMTKKLITKVLKTSYPDTTDEEIDNISLEHINELSEAIMKLHNLEKGRGVNVKDVIAKRRQAIKDKENSNK